MRSTKPLLLAALTAGVLALAGCASSSDTDTGSASTSPAGGSSSGGPTAGGGGSSAAVSANGTNVKDVIVSIKDGKVSPSLGRVKVDKGTTVKILVRSDADDEVHVHGYEKESEVSATQPALIVFTANQTGLFEVETHKTDKVLFLLQVS